MAQSRKEFWTQHISDMTSIGQSVSDYCRQRGLNRETFLRWRRRLLTKSRLPGNALASVAFEEVEISSHFQANLDLGPLDQKTLCGIIQLLAAR